MLEFIIAATLCAAFLILVSRNVRKNDAWSATVTPLASIIGSGFLVSVPLIASAIGIWAVLAVAVLTGLAYLIGGAIRYNIRHAEPILEKAETGHPVRSIETLSHLVLTGAYFISVAYYLVLLAAFAMKLVGWTDPLIGDAIAAGLIVLICGIGATKGLRGVEQAEEFTVSANLAAIAALLVALAIFAIMLPDPYSWTASAEESHPFDWDTLRFLMGLLIIVQGFETTRFMGDIYDANHRIRAMRRAQIVSAAIYLVFFLLMIPLYPYFTSSADVAGFIDVIGRVSPWLPFIVAGGAIASQFSASVADSIGASELVSDTSRKHITPKHAFLLLGAIGVFIVSATDVTSIVALASRAFALFYGLQCTVAAMVAHGRGETGRIAWFGLLAALAYAVAVFGIPAAG